MSQVVDTIFTGSELDRALVAPHADVDADVWKAIVANQHYLWSRKGARMHGRIFASEPYTTDSASYVQTNSAGGVYDLKQWYGVCQPQRREVGMGSPTYGFALIIYGKNIDVQATCTRFNDGSTTTLGTWSASAATGTDYLWAQGTTSYTEAQCHLAGSTANSLATLGFFIEARRNSAPSGVGELLTWCIVERIGAVAQLPDK